MKLSVLGGNKLTPLFVDQNQGPNTGFFGLGGRNKLFFHRIHILKLHCHLYNNYWFVSFVPIMVPYNWCKSYSFTLEGMGFELKKKPILYHYHRCSKKVRLFVSSYNHYFPNSWNGPYVPGGWIKWLHRLNEITLLLHCTLLLEIFSSRFHQKEQNAL